MAIEVFHFKVRLRTPSPTRERIDFIYYDPNEMAPQVRSYYETGPQMDWVIPSSWLLMAKVHVAPCASVIQDKDIERVA